MEQVLKIFGSNWYHDNCAIIGDKVALTDLRNAIDKAISSGNTESVGVFESDGEGYDLNIKCCNEKELDEMPLHYTDKEDGSIGSFNKGKNDNMLNIKYYDGKQNSNNTI